MRGQPPPLCKWAMGPAEVPGTPSHRRELFSACVQAVPVAGKFRPIIFMEPDLYSLVGGPEKTSVIHLASQSILVEINKK